MFPDETQASGRADGLPIRLASVLLVAAIGVVSARHAVRVFDRTWSEYGEGSLLAIVERMRVEPVGPGWLARAPYTLNSYGPGYFAVVGAVAAWTPWDHTIIPGRLVSLFAALATGVVIGWVARREGCPPEVALAGVLAYLSSRYVVGWTPFYRVDHLAVLSVVASYAAVGARRRGWLPAAALLAVGTLVKPSALLAALPITFSLGFHRRLREASWFAAVTAGLVAASWMAVDWSTGSYTSALGVRAGGTEWNLAKGIGRGYAFLCTPLAIAALAALAPAFCARGAGMLGSLYSCALVGETALATALASKHGAAYNYFLASSALATLCVCTFGLSPLAARNRRRTAVMLCGLAVALPYASLQYLKDVHDGEVALGTTVPGPIPPGWKGEQILADGHGFCMEFVLASGASIPVNDSFLLWSTAADGSPEWAGIVAAMETGRIIGLALAFPVEAHHHQNLWPPSVVRAMERYYLPCGGWPGIRLYRHRSLAPGAGSARPGDIRGVVLVEGRCREPSGN